MRNIYWVLILLLLVGCSDQKIIEEVGFVRTITFDIEKGKDPKDQVRISLSIPLAMKKEKLLFSTAAKSSKQARVIFSRQNNRTIVSGQMRTVIFGSDLAKEGIWDHIDSLIRDPTVGRKIHVVMADGEAKKLLTRKYTQDPTAGEYINDLLERETEATDIPLSNLHTFTRDYYDDGIDPAVPILKLEKVSLRVAGVAFFHDGRYVTRIQPEQSLIYTAMRENLHTGEISLSVSHKKDGEDQVILGYIASDRKIKVKHTGPISNGENIHVDIHIKMKGSLLDYTGDLNLASTKNQEKLEGLLATYIETEAMRIIEKTQKYKVDPVGIGQYVRNSLSYKDWIKLKWYEVYPNIKVKVHAKVLIKEYGKMQ